VIASGRPPIPCFVLPHVPGGGAGSAHMAMDEALMDAVAADGATAMLRTYSWAEPTLSLGYFQSIHEAEADPRWQGVPIVRRPTGGGAIWHEAEVTYAVALPASHPLARRPADLYRAVHGAISEALRCQGVAATRRGGAVGGGNRPFLCFADRDPEDLVVAGSKVVGSAQRRRAGAILQHGSLLLVHSEVTPELPGVADLAGVGAAEAPWHALLHALIPVALDLAPRDQATPPSVLARAAALEQGTYRQPAWTRRR